MSEPVAVAAVVEAGGTDEKAPKAENDRGDFFAVDRHAWADVCKLGMNPAVAYLVLARFTGRDQSFTAASVHAVEKYTGISRGRSRVAIENLEAAGLVTREGNGRRIAPPKPAALPRTDFSEDAIIGHIRRGERYRVDLRSRPAKRLLAAGRIRRDARGRLEVVEPPAPAKEPGDWIWLPNALVSGAASEVPPVELIRQTADPLAVRLMVELYHSQNLAENGGIHWRLIRESHPRHRVIERGAYTVWAFAGGRTEVFSDATFWEPKTPQAFWDAWHKLIQAGIVEMVGHLVEADTAQAEILHAFPTRPEQGTDLERELGATASRIARSWMTEKQVDDARKALAIKPGYVPWFAPVPRHVSDVQLMGIARLRYRPRTKLTAAWYADMVQRCESYLERFRALEAAAAG